MKDSLTIVDVSALKLPADGPTLQERQRQGHVHDLRRSIEDPDVGELAPPIVDADTLEVLDGGDRIAAHVLAGHSHVEVSLRKVDGRARQKILLAGNAVRRHEPERQAREMRRLYELALADEVAREHEGRMQAHLHAIGRSDPKVRGKRGRPSKPAGRAARKVAASLGVKPNSVAKAMRRYDAKLEKLRGIELHEGDLLRHEYFDATFTIDCCGQEPPEELEVKVAILKRHVWRAMLELANAGARVKRALDTGYGLSAHHVKAWARDVEELRLRLETIAPQMLCVACRGKGCDECDGRGWLDGIGG